MELTELRDTFEAEKKSMEATITALQESNTRERDEAIRHKMHEMKEQFSTELKRAAADHERKVSGLAKELEDSRGSLAALQDEKQQLGEEWRDSRAAMEEEIGRLSSAEEYLRRQTETLAREHECELNERVRSYQGQVARLEEENERLKSDSQEEVEQARRLWEETLAQMKRHFENQAEELEQKALTEKQRREEYWGEQLADSEARHQEEYNLLSEEAESLREENQEMKNFLTSQINNLEH